MLKQRGHTPVIFEKTNELGGLYITASAMSFKEADKALLRWYERELKKNDIEVRFNMEINAPATLRREFDEIIVCTASPPQDPAGQGLQQDHQLHPAAVEPGGRRRPHRLLRRRPVRLRGRL